MNPIPNKGFDGSSSELQNWEVGLCEVQVQTLG